MKEKKDMSQISNSKKSKNIKTQLQGLALETLKKFDVNLDLVKNEVTITNFEMVDYEEKNNCSVFGEKESISYVLSFTIYNIEFQTKLLTFEYGKKSELLKLNIHCKTDEVVKEIKYCCNSLQRRRNLNLMFTTLIAFSRYIECRRLICALVLQRNKYTQLEENKNGGKIVVYIDEKSNIRLGVFWSIECNSDHDVTDKVEVYYKSTELPSCEEIRTQLTRLTEPHLEFNEKYHLWNNILATLSKKNSIVIVDEDLQNISDSTNSDNISVLRHTKSLLDRNVVKKEEPEDSCDCDDDVSMLSSTSEVSAQTETAPLVCIKNSEALSKNSTQAAILLSDNECQETCIPNSTKSSNDSLSHIIYIDSQDDDHKAKTNNHKLNKTKVSSPLLKYPPDYRSLNMFNPFSLAVPLFYGRYALPALKTRSYDINRHPSSSKEKYKNNININKNVTKSALNSVSSTQVSGSKRDAMDCTSANSCDVIDLISSPKKAKISDDDLEITGVTYVVPD